MIGKTLDVTILVAILVLGGLLLDRREVATLAHHSVKGIAGKSYVAEIAGQRNRVCLGTTYSFVTDQEGTVWELQPRTTMNLSKVVKGPFKSKITKIVPRGAAPGPAVSRSYTLSYCNFMQRLWPIKKVHKPQPFEILE